MEVNKGLDIFLSICKAHGFKPAKIKYVSSLLLIFYMIAEGEGFTIAGPHIPVNDYYNNKIDILPISDDAYISKNSYGCKLGKRRRQAIGEAVYIIILKIKKKATPKCK